MLITHHIICSYPTQLHIIITVFQTFYNHYTNVKQFINYYYLILTLMDLPVNTIFISSPEIQSTLSLLILHSLKSFSERRRYLRFHNTNWLHNQFYVINNKLYIIPYTISL